MTRLYLAGPEVFLPDARVIMERKSALTRQYGFDPICPGDADIPPAETPMAFGQRISAVDEEMMNGADGIIANLTPFRGIAADVGTSFELGYMCAQNKLVAAYTNVAQNHFARTSEWYNGHVTRTEDGYLRGTDGLALEDFGMIDNLMLHGGVVRRGGHIAVHAAPPDALYTDLTAFEDCLRALAQRMNP